MFSTEGINLPILSYLLTPFGASKIRSCSEMLQEEVINAAKSGLIQYLDFRKIFDPKDYEKISQGFEFYIRNDIRLNSNYDLPSSWQRLYYEHDIECFRMFCQVAYEIVQIPSTESPVERAFSQLGFLLNPLRRELTPDHINDLMIVKSHVYLKPIYYFCHNDLIMTLSQQYRVRPELTLE